MRGLIKMPLSLRLPSHLIAGEPLVSLACDYSMDRQTTPLLHKLTRNRSIRTAVRPSLLG